jgi:hypothetical protein
VRRLSFPVATVPIASRKNVFSTPYWVLKKVRFFSMPIPIGAGWDFIVRTIIRGKVLAWGELGRLAPWHLPCGHLDPRGGVRVRGELGRV